MSPIDQEVIIRWAHVNVSLFDLFFIVHFGHGQIQMAREQWREWLRIFVTTMLNDADRKREIFRQGAKHGFQRMESTERCSYCNNLKRHQTILRYSLAA